MPLLGTISAQVFGGVDVTKFIKPYESLIHCTEADLAAEHIIATFPYYSSEKIQQRIK